jgi:hypothetical protein
MVDTGIQHGSELWKDKRFDQVTGTDVAKILGLHRSVTRKRLLELKWARAEEEADEYGALLMFMGREFEPAAIQAYLGWSGNEGYVPNLHVHLECPWLAGSPDLLIPETRTVIEVKTHFYPSPLESKPIGDVFSVKMEHYLQVQTYLEIMDWEDGRLVSWTPNNGFTVFSIKRDAALWREIMPALEEFHRAYEAKTTLPNMKAVDKERWTFLVHTSIRDRVRLLKGVS